MLRILVAALAGGLFGAGLWVSGMTDTAKVLGWLDLFGAWDPTLAFVMGGAILPMAAAWAWSRGRRPLLAPAFPARHPPAFDRGLILGSVLFGVGWGMAGLCPGPAIAALGWGGLGGVLFLVAMAGGMAAAPPVARAISAPAVG
jgi:hypothetical protein